VPGFGLPPNPPPDNSTPTVPSHLAVGNQQFDASVDGLRAYLETKKATNPALYMRLAPDLERLEAKSNQARAALVTGLVVGLAAGFFAFAGRQDCAQPSPSAPNFSANVAAWSACNDDNARRMMLGGLVAGGALLAGSAAAYALTPDRGDLLEFVNRHNRLSSQPLRLQLGYDPAQRLAFGGFALRL
jgi:hypothetical protein